MSRVVISARRSSCSSGGSSVPDSRGAGCRPRCRLAGGRGPRPGPWRPPDHPDRRPPRRPSAGTGCTPRQGHRARWRRCRRPRRGRCTAPARCRARPAGARRGFCSGRGNCHRAVELGHAVAERLVEPGPGGEPAGDQHGDDLGVCGDLAGDAQPVAPHQRQVIVDVTVEGRDDVRQDRPAVLLLIEGMGVGLVDHADAGPPGVAQDMQLPSAARGGAATRRR